jgi:hypothetical protein
MHDQGPKPSPKTSRVPHFSLPLGEVGILKSRTTARPESENSKLKPSSLPLRALCGEPASPWIPDSKLPPLPENSPNSLIRKILLATPVFPRFYADVILATRPNSHEAKILRPHYQNILEKVNAMSNDHSCRWRNERCENGRCGDECRCWNEYRCGDGRFKCGDGRLRPSSKRSERAFPRHNHDCRPETRSRNPPTRFQDPKPRSTPTKPAPPFAPFEARKRRLYPRPAQAARDSETSSEGAQDCSPRRKAWVTWRKEAQAPRGERKTGGPIHLGSRTAEGGCPHMVHLQYMFVVLAIRWDVP